MKFDFSHILALILRLAVPVTLAVETGFGQATSGADKKTMATTALSEATDAALSLLPPGSQNAGYAQAASTLASAAIDAAVSFTKKTGAYATASAAAAAVVQ